MNTAKQINIMVALVFIAVIAAGAYTLWDPSRASSAKDEQLKKTLDRAAYTFSQNCRVCHGNSGEGGLKANRLAAAPALNRPDLQGRTQAGGAVDIAARTTAFQRVYYTITCGRMGTAMPTWGDTQGGTLNDEQIKQLATLITDGTGWAQADLYSLYGVPEAHIAGEATDGLVLAKDLSATDTTVYLNKVTTGGSSPAPIVAKGDRLQVVATGKAPSDSDEVMTVTDINAAQNSVTVTRPVGSTKAVAHKAGDQVTKPAVPPNPPAITGKDTPPACGQNPPAVAPSPAATATPGGPTPTPQPVSATLTIAAQNTLFDKSSLAAPAGQPLTLTFDNKDSGIPHNIQFFKGTDATGTSVGKTDIAAGPVTQTLTFGPLDAGTYYFHCDVHPTTMFGTLTVR